MFGPAIVLDEVLLKAVVDLGGKLTKPMLKGFQSRNVISTRKLFTAANAFRIEAGSHGFQVYAARDVK